MIWCWSSALKREREFCLKPRRFSSRYAAKNKRTSRLSIRPDLCSFYLKQRKACVKGKLPTFLPPISHIHGTSGEWFYVSRLLIFQLYDRKGSLRLCVENDLHRAAVHLYCALNLHVEAVELALKIDPLLAKQIAKSVTLEEDIRKRLWLLIAQHLVAQDSDISKATELLQVGCIVFHGYFKLRICLESCTFARSVVLESFVGPLVSH